MALSECLSDLKQRLSAEARVITDASHKDFQLALLRWSDVDVKIPAAIVQVTNEFDAVQTVCSSSMLQNTKTTDWLGENCFTASDRLCPGLRWSQLVVHNW